MSFFRLPAAYHRWRNSWFVPTKVTAQLTNTAEGGTHATGVTTGNSGGSSGDAFSAVTTEQGTMTFDNTRPHHGSLAYKSVKSGAGSNYAEWGGSTQWPEILDRAFFRGYYNFDTAPDADTQFLAFINLTTWVLRVRLNTTRTISLINSAGTVLGTSTTVLAVDTWYRIEMTAMMGSSSTGSAELRLYAGDATSPTETLGPYTATDTGLTPIVRVITGSQIFTGTTNTLTTFFDDLAFDAYDWIGPSAGAAAGQKFMPVIVAA